jgi:hypothetical protein
MNAPKYIGIVEMGANYSSPRWDVDAYVWDTLGDVLDSLASIRRGYGVRANVAEWNKDGSARAGNWDDSVTPCAEPAIILARNGADALTSMEREGVYAADRVAFYGPRGGMRVGTVDQWYNTLPND